MADAQRFKENCLRGEKRKGIVFQKEALRFRKRSPSFCKKKTFLSEGLLGGFA